MNPRSLRIRLLQAAALTASLVFTSLPVYPQAPDAPIVGVYPAQDRQDKAALYAVVQQLPPPPENMDVPQEWRSGVPLRVMIHRRAFGGDDYRAQTSRRRPLHAVHGAAFFHRARGYSGGPVSRIERLASRAGPVTYLYVKGKEFALFHIRVQRTAEGLRLDNAELMRTGFMIPIFKERIRLRFEAPLPAGSLKDEVVKAALADTGLFMRDRR